jgi:hypothetical protein
MVPRAGPIRAISTPAPTHSKCRRFRGAAGRRKASGCTTCARRPRTDPGLRADRSGKGVGLIPTLLAWSESAIVYDIKGENSAN